MASKDEFDNKIKELLIKNQQYKEDDFSNTDYPVYFHIYKDAYIDFIDKMGPQIRELYKKELTTTLANMASVASSSRFCYIALKDKNGVEFEKKCPCLLNSKGTANLDAYIEKDNTYYEVKCHEIFDSHKTIKLSISYKNALFDEKGFNFDENNWKISRGNYVTQNIEGLEFKRFDGKQFLCHLLGIANEQNKSKDRQPAKLKYVFFKPKCEEFDGVFKELEDEVCNIFNVCRDNPKISKFLERYDIHLEAEWECSEVMEPLTDENRVVIYPVD